MTHVILLDAFGMGFYTLAKDLIVKFARKHWNMEISNEAHWDDSWFDFHVFMTTSDKNFRSTIKIFKCDIFEKTFKQGNC